MPSRRELIQLTDAERADLAATARTLIIISNGKDGYPHPMPMWFHTDPEGCMYCTTFRKAQKVLNFERDARASLLIESGEEYAELRGLVVYARAEIIDDLDTVVDVLVNINSKGASVDAAQREALAEAVRPTAEKRVVLKFTPERFVSWDHSKLGGRY